MRVEKSSTADLGFGKSKKPNLCLYEKSSGILFGIGHGHDIRVDKKGQSGSHCNQHSFNYNGATNVLCGYYCPSNFTPQRMTVIQVK